MVVTCPACGGVSRDEEFCDRCNTDLVLPPASLPPATCSLGPESTLQLTGMQLRELAQPEASVTVTAASQAWRLRWIPGPLWPRWQPAVDERLAYQIPCLSPARVIPHEDGFWVVAEAAAERCRPWVENERLDGAARAGQLADFLNRFGEALQGLHAAGLVWLSFDPGELEMVNGRLRFTNLDLMVFPAGQCPPQLTIAPAYAAPEVCRFQAAAISARTDIFHLAMFAYYWLACYLPQGFLGDGLETFHYALPPIRILAPDLPPGISAVLARALAVEPEQRYSSTTEFVTAFRSALVEAERRRQSFLPVSWEIGVHTRAGLSKTARGGVNEDCVLVRPFSAPERALVVVADGISSCDVGSGDLASRMVCDVVAAAFGPDSLAADFPQLISTACRQGAQRLLEWAVEHGYSQRLLLGDHLMGTTLTAAWLEGNSLTLANLGDSRAYLIQDGRAEQLTVDGDLGCTLLAANASPEEVQDLGPLAKALRNCVGGCYRTPEGALAIDEDRCQPALARWQLLPHDVIVLCTDGLVEEGVFLDPAELAALVREYQALPAAALAEKLATLADARQRPPSPEEPEGFGDNITCAVIKIAHPC